MSCRRYLLLLACVAYAQGATPTIAKDLSFQMQEIETGLNVGYAVRILDMNDDARPDIVVVDTNRVVWYENPDWNRHTLIEDQTKLDNVCIAPYDIDGDGRVDFALGADWRPADTVSSGSLQWLARGAAGNGEQGDGDQGDGDQDDGDQDDGLWTVHPIGEEPTIHRINWADFDGDGRAELIVVPLMGRGTTRPLFAERPIRILSYAIPADPVAGPWTPTVINEDLHVAHNFEATDMDGDGKLDLLVVSFEGVSVLRRGDDGTWTRTLIGSGNQETSPNRGASEVKRGRLAAGDYVATIEPWHGFQVATYTRPEREGELWTRHLLDDQLQWGHAVWAVNLDDDADEELVIGVRDNQPAGEGLSGVRIYDPTDVAAGQWQRQLVDPGGVAVEDLSAADLDGDGRADIIAVGRATHNVRIYWNRD